jgi:PQQ-dependent catabolism-associated CXXCW motif protein
VEVEVNRRTLAFIRPLWLLPALAAAGLLLASVPEPSGYWTGDIGAPVPASLRGGKVIQALQVSKLLEAGDVVIVDVSNEPRRPDHLAPGAPWLPPVHRAIPGAMWLPGVGLGNPPEALIAFFQRKLAEATSQDFSRPIVVYCHQRCWLSWNAAKRAISFGYRNVSWLPEGIEGWKAEGLSTLDAAPQQPDGPDSTAP